MPSALSSLIESLGSDARGAVLARAGGAWEQARSPFGHDVRALAAALRSYGLQADDPVAVLGAEGCGTLCAGLAVIAAGAVLVPLDPSMSDDALRRAFASTAAVQAIAADERQLARILALRPDLPALELVLLVAAPSSERQTAALLVSSAIDVGRRALESDPSLLRAAFAESEGGVSCLLLDSKGDAQPLRRAALADLAETFVRFVSLRSGEAVLVRLPVGGSERLGISLAALSRGATLLLADSAERPDAGLDEHPAHVISIDMGGLERLHRSWNEDIDAKSWPLRYAARWALGQSPSVGQKGWKHRIADTFVLKGIRRKLGGRTSTLDLISAARGTAPYKVEEFFRALGLRLRYFSPGSGSRLAR